MAKKKTKKERKEAVRKFSQGLSNVPLLGDFTRLFRYPAETGRQIGGLTRYLGSRASGVDEEKLREIFEEYQNPMFINQDENRKMTGEAGPFSSLLEGMSAGSEASWFLPYGKVDKLVKPAIAAKMGGKAGSRLVPWLGGKAAEAVVRGPFTGLAASDTSKPGEIPGNIAKSIGTQAAFNIALGGIGEAGKAIRDSGTRLKTAGLGMAQKGDTTQKMADKLSGAKKMEGLGVTAQGQYDRGVRKLDELTTNKNKALEGISPKQVTSIAGEAKNKFEKAIKSALRSDELKNSSAYNNIVKGFKKIGSSADLDDLAIEAGSKVPYGAKDPISTVDKEVYDIARDVIVKTLKSKSKDYSAAKSLIDQVISRSGTQEVTNRAFKEAGGSTLPVLIAQLEMPVQAKSLSSLLASAVGGGQRALGGAMQSPTLQGLGSQAITRGIVGAGNQSVPQTTEGLETQQIQPQGMGMQQPVGGQPMGQAEVPSDFDPIAIALQEQGFSVGQQQQPQQQFDAQRLAMDLVQAVSAGQMSTAQADWIFNMMQQTYGGPQQTLNEKPQSIQEAYDLVGSQYPGISDSVRLSMAKEMLGGGGMSRDIINAKTAYEDLVQVNQMLDGGSSKVPWQSILPKEGGNPEAQTLDNAIRNIADVIARTRTGAAMNLREEELYTEFGPTVWDTEESRRDKLQRLENLFLTVMEGDGIDVSSLRGQIGTSAVAPINEDYDSWQY